MDTGARMTKDEIDTMWQQAMQESIKNGEMYTRYRFAKLLAEAERQACAAMSDWILKEGGGTWGDAIRARGQA
jgi:hypothetical protein